MFFLGLLSTPLPYLLLAAFYFFGFAMGMFNNKTGDEVVEIVSSVTIPVAINQKTTDHRAYYFQVNNSEKQAPTEVLKPEATTTAFIPDTGPSGIKILDNIKVHEIRISGFLFLRPPPAIC
jgi:hypothetical protein